MAFSKKKKIESVVQVDQDNVAMLATEALAKMRSVRVQLLVKLVFNSPLLMKRWEVKALSQMLGSMTGHKELRVYKDLTADYEASWYRNADGKLALPCRIIKAAIVRGAVALDNSLVTGADIKRQVRVLGYTSPIHVNGKMEMDIRVVKNKGTPDVRARSIIPAGSWVEVVLQFPPTFGPDRVMAALDSAGNSAGLCEMRPEKGGELGTFDVSGMRSDTKEINRVLKECSVPEEELKIPAHMLRALGSIPNDKLTDKAKKAKAVIEHINEQHRANGKSRAHEEAAES